MGDKVTFRRINGRIVPIRQKGDTSERPKSSAKPFVAALAVGAATAEAAAQAVKRSADIRMAAKKEFRIGYALEKAARKASQIGQQTLGFEMNTAKGWKRTQAAKRDIARMIFKARNPILAIGTTAAASLLGTAISRSKWFKKKNRDEQLMQDLGATAAAALGIGTLYYSRLGVGPVKKAFDFALSRYRGIPKPFIPIKGVQGVLKF